MWLELYTVSPTRIAMVAEGFSGRCVHRWSRRIRKQDLQIGRGVGFEPRQGATDFAAGMPFSIPYPASRVVPTPGSSAKRAIFRCPCWPELPLSRQHRGLLLRIGENGPWPGRPHLLHPIELGHSQP